MHDPPFLGSHQELSALVVTVFFCKILWGVSFNVRGSVVSTMLIQRLDDSGRGRYGEIILLVL